MTEMIERVAKSILKVRFYDPEPHMYGNDPEDFFYQLDPDHIIDAHDEARAAIEAMREPTNAQLEAAEDIVVGYDDFATGDGNIYLGIPNYPQKARDVWAALVAAALKEKP